MELVLTKVRSIQVDTYKLRRLDHRRLYCDTAHFDMKKRKKKKKKRNQFINLWTCEFMNSSERNQRHVNMSPSSSGNELGHRVYSCDHLRLSRIIRDCSIYCIWPTINKEEGLFFFNKEESILGVWFFILLICLSVFVLFFHVIEGSFQGWDARRYFNDCTGLWRRLEQPGTRILEPTQ